MTTCVAAVPWTASSVAARDSGGYEVIDLEKPYESKAPGGAASAAGQRKREAVAAAVPDPASKCSRLGSDPVNEMTEDEFLAFLLSGNRPGACKPDKHSNSGRAGGRAGVGEGSSAKSELRLPTQSDPRSAGVGAGGFQMWRATYAAVTWYGDPEPTRQSCKRQKSTYEAVIRNQMCSQHHRPLSRCGAARRPCACQWTQTVQLKAFALQYVFAVLMARRIKNAETRDSLCVANLAGQFAVMYVSTAEAPAAYVDRKKLLLWAQSRCWCKRGNTGGSRGCQQCTPWAVFGELAPPVGFEQVAGWALVEIGPTPGAALEHLRQVGSEDGMRHIAAALGVPCRRESIYTAVRARQMTLYGEAGLDFITHWHFVRDPPRYSTRIKSVRMLRRSVADVKPPQGAGKQTWVCGLAFDSIDFDKLSDRETRFLWECSTGRRTLCKACLVLYECDVDLDRHPCMHCRRPC